MKKDKEVSFLNKAVGQLLCSGIAHHGSVVEFAKAIGASASTVHRWLRGACQPTRASACRIVEACNARPESNGVAK